MALQSIAEAFPNETQFLTSSAACQITAISQRIVAMARSPYSINNDDLGQTLLRSLAVRVGQLSETLGALSGGEAFEVPVDELRDACLCVEGVYPQHLALPEGCRRAFGLSDDSPIGRGLRDE